MKLKKPHSSILFILVCTLFCSSVLSTTYAQEMHPGKSTNASQPSLSATEWQSEIVFEDEEGRLTYVSDEEGNRIPDFSHAGYRGGGIDLPDIPIVHTISPVEGDNTNHLQEAINVVSALDPNADGVRGALFLEAGIYEVSETLTVLQSGVVIRGAGNASDSTNNTIIRRIGTLDDPVLRIGNASMSNAWAEAAGTRSDIISPFIPVGSRSFRVEQPDLYSIGDQIIVLHPMSEAWIDAIDGGGTATDPNWETDEFDIAYTRIVEDIQNDSLFIDAPVFNHLDRSLTQSYIYKRDNTGEIQEVGIENLRITIETQGPLTENHARTAIEFTHVANAWARNITAEHFIYAGIDVRRSIHVTVKDSEALEPHSEVTGGRRYNFATYRSQLVLFENNLATEARHAYVGNGEAWDSGIVFLNNISRNASTSSEPHRHWGQGFLYDNHQELESLPRVRRILLGNRGSFGTSHGWSAVHSVVWNCSMRGSGVVVQKPPTAQNYAIGCEGYVSGEGPFSHPVGYIEGTNRPDLYPSSLYLRQLEDRGFLPANVSIESEQKRPATNVVDGNAPNPFRTTTRLTYRLDAAGHVRFEVFDVLGRPVALLVDTYQHSGNHSVTFDASNLPSGMYMYQLTTTNSLQSGSMVKVN